MQHVIASRKIRNNDLNFELVTVSPHLARQWLDCNVKNRKIKKSFLTRLVSDIKAGNWRITGEAIKFATDGTLLDGQHRLQACIDADMPIVTLVVYGVPNEVQNVMDTGVSRLASDILTMRGLTNGANVAACLRILLNEKLQRPVGSGGNSLISNSEILKALDRHPNLPLYVPTAGSLPRGISSAMVGYVRYVTTQFCDQQLEGEEMFKVLQTGIPSYEGDAIHAFRERIIREGIDRSTLGGTGKQVIFDTFKLCWNKFVMNEEVRHLKWMRSPVAIRGLKLSDL